MTNIRAIISRFPMHDLLIRRLCARDPAFRDACDDYEKAVIAWHHWEGAGDIYTLRAGEYRELVVEIESDILSELTPHLTHISQTRN